MAMLAGAGDLPRDDVVTARAGDREQGARWCCRRASPRSRAELRYRAFGCPQTARRRILAHRQAARPRPRGLLAWTGVRRPRRSRCHRPSSVACWCCRRSAHSREELARCGPVYGVESRDPETGTSMSVSLTQRPSSACRASREARARRRLRLAVRRPAAPARYVVSFADEMARRTSCSRERRQGDRGRESLRYVDGTEIDFARHG